MNNDFSKTITTIFLADVRPLKNNSLFSFYLSKVTPERRQDIERKHYEEDRLLSLGGGILLDHLLEKWAIGDQIVHNEQGKPLVLHHPDIHVSLTHSYPFAAAMISHSPCGLDIERRDRDLEAVARRYFTPDEKALCADNPDCRTDIWCRKECWIKCYYPQDVRHIDTCSIPEDYEFIHLLLPLYSFEILKKKGPFEFHEFHF